MVNLLEVFYAVTLVSAALALGYRLAARRGGEHRRRLATRWAAVAVAGAIAAAGLYIYLSARV